MLEVFDGETGDKKAFTQTPHKPQSPQENIKTTVSASINSVITTPKIVFTFHTINLATTEEDVIFALAKRDLLT